MFVLLTHLLHARLFQRCLAVSCMPDAATLLRLLLQLFMKRLELCDDPAAKEYLRYTTAQMLEGGFTYSVSNTSCLLITALKFMLLGSFLTCTLDL